MLSLAGEEAGRAVQEAIERMYMFASSPETSEYLLAITGKGFKVPHVG